MKEIKYKLKNGYRIITEIDEGTTVKGLENLLSSIENLKEKDDDYIFKICNNGKKYEIVVKAKDIISVELVF